MDDVTTRLRTVEVAREALLESNQRLQELQERREVAVNAMIDYALAAYVEGETIESIMEAIAFAGPAEQINGLPPFIAQLLGIQPQEGMTRIQGFAQWLGQSLAERVMERHSAENQ